MTKLLAIVGPTCSGKSALAMSLASRLNGEIVSADSRQIYKYLDIGTSKPSEEDRRQVRHHFVDILDPRDEYSAGAFGTEARKVIEEILAAGRLPILVGGSGLYIKGVIDGFFEGPAKDPEVRGMLERLLKREGSGQLLETLRKVDPVSAATMDESKSRRIIRALEVYYITGKPISRHHEEQPKFEWMDCVQIGIDQPRSELYRRISDRVESMIARGLVEEVREIHAKGYERTLNSLNSVGYKEVFDYFEGAILHEEMIALIKRNTRRFAKRQLTWFRSDKRIRWMAAGTQRTAKELLTLAEDEYQKA